ESLAIDGALAAEGATLALLDALEKAGPFGAGHVAPVFALPRHRLTDARPVGTNHIRAELQSQSGGRIQAIAFRAVDTALGEFLFRNRGRTVHIAGSLSGNYWNGNRTVQFRITDAALA
ncbi:MAG: single-stranded-DNA-specific exonuclease RecJ, partial [Mesorhizobium sp.]